MKKQLLKKLSTIIVIIMMFSASANAQSREQISYYFKGQKVYYPVSYERLIIEPIWRSSEAKPMRSRRVSSFPKKFPEWDTRR